MKRPKELLFTGIFLFIVAALVISCDSPTDSNRNEPELSIKFYEYNASVEDWRVGVLVRSGADLPVDATVEMYADCNGEIKYNSETFHADESDVTYIVKTRMQENINDRYCTQHWVEIDWKGGRIESKRIDF